MGKAETSKAYEAIETACRNEITALQLERLRWSLRHAYDNLAHYRQTHRGRLHKKRYKHVVNADGALDLRGGRNGDIAHVGYGLFTGGLDLIDVWRDGHLDVVAVNVELKPEHRFASAAEIEFVAHDLQHHIKSYIGISTQVRFSEIGGIERSVGKARRVIDKRPR